MNAVAFMAKPVSSASSRPRTVQVVAAASKSGASGMSASTYERLTSKEILLKPAYLSRNADAAEKFLESQITDFKDSHKAWRDKETAVKVAKVKIQMEEEKLAELRASSKQDPGMEWKLMKQLAGKKAELASARIELALAKDYFFMSKKSLEQLGSWKSDALTATELATLRQKFEALLPEEAKSPSGLAAHSPASLMNAGRNAWKDGVRWIEGQQFSKAVLDKNFGMAVTMLRAGFDIGAESQTRALSVAAKEGAASLVENILRLGVATVDSNENEAIRLASQNGHYDIVKMLIESGKADPSAVNSESLRLAASQGHFRVVELLLEYSTKVRPDTAENEAIRMASANGHVDVVRRLLQDERVNPTQRDNQAIKLASSNGHFEVVQLLLEFKRVPVDPSAEEHWAVRYAIINGHSSIVELFLKDTRVNPAVSNKHYQLLPPLAAMSGRTDILEMLIATGKIDVQTDSNFAISRAVARGNEKMVEILLKAGADPSVNDNAPLKDAAYRGYAGVVEMLLADERVYPKAGKDDALCLAVSNRHTNVLQVLLQSKKIDPTLDGSRSFYIALDVGNSDIVNLFLQDGRVNPAHQPNLLMKSMSSNVYILLKEDPRVLAIEKLLSDPKLVLDLSAFQKLIDFSLAEKSTQYIKDLLTYPQVEMFLKKEVHADKQELAKVERLADLQALFVKVSQDDFGGWKGSERWMERLRHMDVPFGKWDWE